jgi:hypothetical protein
MGRNRSATPFTAAAASISPAPAPSAPTSPPGVPISAALT